LSWAWNVSSCFSAISSDRVRVPEHRLDEAHRPVGEPELPEHDALLLVRQALHHALEVADDVGHVTHVALGVVRRDAELLPGVRVGDGLRLELAQDDRQAGAGRLTLEALVREHHQDGGALLDVLVDDAQRGRGLVQEGLGHLLERRGRLDLRGRQNVADPGHVDHVLGRVVGAQVHRHLRVHEHLGRALEVHHAGLRELGDDRQRRD
jgi:hypothetical protein